MLHSGLIRPLFKTVACAGLLGEALQLAWIGKTVYDRSPNEIAVASGMPSAFENDLAELLASSASHSQLQSYLARISGNQIYRAPREYEAMAADLIQAKASIEALAGASVLPDIQRRVEQDDLGNPGLMVMPHDSEIQRLLEGAELANRRGDYEQAISLYTEALGEGINAPGLRSSTMASLGLVYQQNGDLDRALRWLTSAAESRQEASVIAMSSLAYVLRLQGDLDAAIQWHSQGPGCGGANRRLACDGHDAPCRVLPATRNTRRGHSLVQTSP